MKILSLLLAVASISMTATAVGAQPSMVPPRVLVNARHASAMLTRSGFIISAELQQFTGCGTVAIVPKPTISPTHLPPHAFLAVKNISGGPICSQPVVWVKKSLPVLDMHPPVTVTLMAKNGTTTIPLRPVKP
jgi:hypothetical protein